MSEPNNDFREDEIIEIKLPREEYKILKNIIEREKAFNWFKRSIKNSTIWIIGGGAVTFLLLYDKINVFLHGVK